MTVTHFVDTGYFLICYSNGHTKQPHRQLKKFRYYFNTTLFIEIQKQVNFKLSITEIYQRMPWELVEDPLGSVEHILGSPALLK